MRRMILIAFILILLSACSSAGTDISLSDEPIDSSIEAYSETEPNVFIPPHLLTMEETIEQFFEQQYNSYIDLKYIDISYLLDVEQVRILNTQIWLKNLIQRRKLISIHQLGFVEKTKYPYIIIYEDEAEDIRMEFWRSRGIHNEDEKTVHFTISGDKGRAYPPFLALNSQHTMRLKQVDDTWKVTFHYYPGSSKFRTNTPLDLISQEEVLKDLREEFNPSLDTLFDVATISPTVSIYNGERAVQYAKAYTEEPNPVFYNIDDWMGNCANFTSQCIWYGFGTDNQSSIISRENMTSQWYGGSGGGSPPWENVSNFWNYVTASRDPREKGLHGEVVESILNLDIGGIIQTRQGRFRNTDESFSHNLILVDSSTLLLAQNSPNCFVYYSDLVDVDTRFFNPKYLIK